MPTILDDLNTTTSGALEFDVPGAGDCSLYGAIKGLLLQCMTSQSKKEEIIGVFINFHEKYRSSVAADGRYINSDRPDKFQEFIDDLLELDPKNPSSVMVFAQKYFEKNSRNRDITDGDKALFSLVGCLRKATAAECESIRDTPNSVALYADTDIEQFKPFKEMDVRWVNMVLPENLRFDTQTVNHQGLVTPNGKTFDFSDPDSAPGDIVMSQKKSTTGDHFVLAISQQFVQALKKAVGLGAQASRAAPPRPATPAPSLNSAPPPRPTEPAPAPWNHASQQLHHDTTQQEKIEQLTNELMTSFDAPAPNISKIMQAWDTLNGIKDIRQHLGEDVYGALEDGYNKTISQAQRANKQPPRPTVAG